MKFLWLRKPFTDDGDVLVNLEAVEFFDLNVSGGNAVAHLKSGTSVFLKETLDDIRRLIWVYQ